MGLFTKNKSLAELEEENELKEVELSVAQKRAAIAELKKRGLKPSHFGIPVDFGKIWRWLKTH